MATLQELIGQFDEKKAALAAKQLEREDSVRAIDGEIGAIKRDIGWIAHRIKAALTISVDGKTTRVARVPRVEGRAERIVALLARNGAMTIKDLAKAEGCPGKTIKSTMGNLAGGGRVARVGVGCYAIKGSAQDRHANGTGNATQDVVTP